ncbi:putative glycosyltransferase 6 domain-containing protein 1 [Microcebus murinus]|uniref:Glycosyltransferase 6 domain containing 1 n=1 Tax=Microcebus murinus TaxID=30608 RepID=A0A8B7HJH3_MICMU|nr:glycosyltransferase 6 domain-containing protein 1 [Microcebus murinus]XP_012637544.1 glycosyltransferase 6 domain-containing protein 1 [Microcebus murinus]XP_020145147.1 glycosyltransferase 6 domain-containing protein 1 [Microcebus murinus]
MNYKRRMLLLISSTLLLILVDRHFRKQEELQLSDWFTPSNRFDVITTTDWLAPVIWDGTFDREALEKHYRGRNITVGLAVFATSRVSEKYVRTFLLSANRHFMPGHRVIFYVLAGALFNRPDVVLGPRRSLRVLPVGRESWWFDANLVHMRSLGEYIVGRIQAEVDFLFSMTPNQVFQHEFGVEALGASVAQLHPWWYFRDAKDFPYERKPGSAAYIPFGQGDFYYDGSLVGGTPLHVLSFIEKYLYGATHDVQKGLNSTYEKHLNKYFFLHKPTTVLSPEYNWDAAFYPPAQVHYVRVVHHSGRKLDDPPGFREDW